MTCMVDAEERQRGARYALRVLMWVISEWNWAIDWAPGLEFALWQAVVEGPPVEGYPFLSHADAEALRMLAVEAQGWYWLPSPDAVEEQFITHTDWHNMYASRRCDPVELGHSGPPNSSLETLCPSASGKA
jgi:hypothetical protein